MSRGALTILALPLSVVAVAAEPISPGSVRVIDGDTIAVAGHEENTRLVGFDTPEKFGREHCPGEHALGQRATDYLQELVDAGGLDLEFVRCSCRPGTEGTRRCNDGRSCAILRSRGVNVGLILIRERLAAPLICGERSCPPLSGPWCSQR